MNLITAGLSAINGPFNNILTQIAATEIAQKLTSEVDAIIAASSIGSALSSLKSGLRSLIPAGLALPNINLQSQLSSLVDISNLPQTASNLIQSSNLISNITGSFGKELTAAGFDLNTLISDAKSAVAAGKSLSFDIPNFEKAADGLGDAFQKAIGVKLPAIDPIKEAIGIITENVDLTKAAAAATNAVLTTSLELPSINSSQFKISENFRNITFSNIGGSITKSLTTPLDDITANISPEGFSSRPVNFSQIFKNPTNVLELKRDPSKISSVTGIVIEEIEGETVVSRFPLVSSGLQSKDIIKKKRDTFTSSGKNVTITQDIKKYDSIIIRYKFHSNYNPNVKVELASA